ncbi:hypothetical protein ACFYVL_43815 [Streptomyces sp. NPDC004111]|uniref:hypothetical protein n=1 Tax=Streptomyces sp. NPDC004111 TaxID=3364690 RepID=UPI003699E6FE
MDSPENELVKKLRSASLKILGIRGGNTLASTVTRAWQSIAGDVEPVETVPLSLAGRDVHLQWLHHARLSGIIDEEDYFLITAVTTGSHEVGWVHVQLIPESDTSLLRDDQDRVEFIGCSLAGDKLCGVTAEEYDYWIVSLPEE